MQPTGAQRGSKHMLLMESRNARRQSEKLLSGAGEALYEAVLSSLRWDEEPAHSLKPLQIIS